MTECFFAGRGRCDGPMDRAHLIAKQRIKREYPYGAVLASPAPGHGRGSWAAAPKAVRPEDYPHGFELMTPQMVMWDERVWVPACRLHHANFDNHAFRIPRAELPAAVEAFAREFNLEWCLDADYE